jgi:hypothetical protein
MTHLSMQDLIANRSFANEMLYQRLTRTERNKWHHAFVRADAEIRARRETVKKNGQDLRALEQRIAFKF